MSQSSLAEGFAADLTRDEPLVASQRVPQALCCPGCTVELEQHDNHGRCRECGRCWVPAADPIPYVHLVVRQPQAPVATA